MLSWRRGRSWYTARSPQPARETKPGGPLQKDLLTSGEINEAKGAQDDSAGKLRAPCHARRGVAGASTGCQNTVSEHGLADQYLMERKAEITLARSAAPESIS